MCPSDNLLHLELQPCDSLTLTLWRSHKTVPHDRALWYGPNGGSCYLWCTPDGAPPAAPDPIGGAAGGGGLFFPDIRRVQLSDGDRTLQSDPGVDWRLVLDGGNGSSSGGGAAVDSCGPDKCRGSFDFVWSGHGRGCNASAALGPWPGLNACGTSDVSVQFNGGEK